MILISLLSVFGFYLAVTILIEVIVVFLLGYRNKDFFKVVILASVVTNLPLTLILNIDELTGFVDITFTKLIFLEMVIVFIEYKILQYVFNTKYDNKRLFKVALIMNGVSFLIGEIFKRDLTNIADSLFNLFS